MPATAAFSKKQLDLASDLRTLAYLIPDPQPRDGEPGIFTGTTAKEKFNNDDLHNGQYLFLRSALARATEVKEVLWEHQIDTKLVRDEHDAKNPQAYFAVSKADLLNWLADSPVTLLLQQCKGLEARVCEEQGSPYLGAAASGTIPLNSAERDRVHAIRNLSDNRGLKEDDYPGGRGEAEIQSRPEENASGFAAAVTDGNALRSHRGARRHTSRSGSGKPATR